MAWMMPPLVNLPQVTSYNSALWFRCGFREAEAQRGPQSACRAQSSQTFPLGRLERLQKASPNGQWPAVRRSFNI
eukprot:359256-Chlamydomonas_euryale.AAC.2